ncbi:MAG: peptidyl-prolyl cis-trans isomerase [Acidobacteria bacterium]|nr:peptidyl-prolyl cis-trans isomerase [Acidobacteriota bacterium]
MRKIKPIKHSLILGGTAAVLLAASAPAYAKRQIVDRIIARVNSEIITQRQFEREQEKLRAQLAQQFSGGELETQIREQSKDLLRDLIDQALMVQKAKDLDLNVETDLVKRLDEIRQNFNLDSLEDLQSEVEKQGLLWEDFKDNIRRNMLMREVIGREVGRTIIISRGDAQKYFEENNAKFSSPGGVHLAQILISSEKRPPEEAEPRAKEAMDELKAGQRWFDVCKKYSDDPTANQGGDIGFLKDGTLAPVIAEAVSKLEINEFTELIPIKTGYLILRLVERLSPGIPPFEQIEQRVMEFLYNQKMAPALRQYLVNLRKESYIFLRPGYVDSGAERPSDALLATTGR